MKRKFINTLPNMVTKELRARIIDAVQRGICSPQDIANFALSLATDSERREVKHG